MSTGIRERGASLPETAIVMAVLLALLFGIADFARAIYTYSFVSNVAREGARWAIVRGAESCTYSNNTLASCNASQTTIQAYVKGLFGGPANPADATVSVSWPPCLVPAGGNAPGCTVAVNVQYNFAFLPFVSHLTIPMSSTSQMVISQ